MDGRKMKYWADLASVMSTIVVVALYVLVSLPKAPCPPAHTREPHKYVPITFDHTAGYAHIGHYRLFKYTETGQPETGTSFRGAAHGGAIPVLFIPGNGGDYQQVQSLASACIGHQVTKWGGARFVFYTADFGGEFSGASGQLIEDQTVFIWRGVDHIIKLHPTNTNGVILVGHSVGGFVAKLYFTMPEATAKKVPLVVSLSGPLAKPYLMLDRKMAELYHRAHLVWKLHRPPTLALSFFGGLSDRLMPMHLSMDVQYDFAMTTTRVQDMFVDTDHATIIRCHKVIDRLAKILSAVVDKKSGRIITHRVEARSAVLNMVTNHTHLLDQPVIDGKNWIIHERTKLRSQTLFEIVSIVIQTGLGKMLALTCYLIYLDTVANIWELSLPPEEDTPSLVTTSVHILTDVVRCLGFVLIYHLTDGLFPYLHDRKFASYDNFDESIYFILVFFGAYGCLQTMKFLMHTMINFVGLLMRAKSALWTLMSGRGPARRPRPEAIHDGKMTNYDLAVIIVVTGLSVVLSPALMSLFSLFTIIEICMFLKRMRERSSIPFKVGYKNRRKRIHDIILSNDIWLPIGAFTLMALLSNAPSALVYLNPHLFGSLMYALTKLDAVQFVQSCYIMVVLKMIAAKLKHKVTEMVIHGNKMRVLIPEESQHCLHSLVLIPLAMVEMNLCNSNLSLATLLSWLSWFSFVQIGFLEMKVKKE